jgi:hypothetical protein
MAPNDTVQHIVESLTLVFTGYPGVVGKLILSY